MGTQAFPLFRNHPEDQWDANPEFFNHFWSPWKNIVKPTTTEEPPPPGHPMDNELNVEVASIESRGDSAKLNDSLMSLSVAVVSMGTVLLFAAFWYLYRWWRGSVGYKRIDDVQAVPSMLTVQYEPY